MTIISDLGTLILKLPARLWRPHGNITLLQCTWLVPHFSFLFTSEMFREMTFFLTNSSFTVLGTGKCVRCNRVCWISSGVELRTFFFFFFLRSVIDVFSRVSFLVFSSEFSLAPCDSFLVSDWTLWCFLRWFDNTLEKSTLIEYMFLFFFLYLGHLQVNDWFVLLHKKGASGVLCSLNKGVLLNLNWRGKINFQTGRAINVFNF